MSTVTQPCVSIRVDKQIGEQTSRYAIFRQFSGVGMITKIFPVKLENIIVSGPGPFPKVLLADFGAARVANSACSTITGALSSPRVQPVSSLTGFRCFRNPRLSQSRGMLFLSLTHTTEIVHHMRLLSRLSLHGLGRVVHLSCTSPYKNDCLCEAI